MPITAPHYPRHLAEAQKAILSSDPLAKLSGLRSMVLELDPFETSIDQHTSRTWLKNLPAKTLPDVIASLAHGEEDKKGKTLYLQGWLSYHGIGTQQSTEQALTAWQASASCGYPAAMRSLGAHYHSEGDYKNSFFWTKKAAEHGDEAAQYQLGKYYAEGIEGALPDQKQAAGWIKNAANQGNAAAELHFAMYYYKGSAATRDLNEAVHWASRAAEQGYKPAKEILPIIRKQLATDQEWVRHAVTANLEQNNASISGILTQFQENYYINPQHPRTVRLLTHVSARLSRTLPEYTEADGSIGKEHHPMIAAILQSEWEFPTPLDSQTPAPRKRAKAAPAPSAASARSSDTAFAFDPSIVQDFTAIDSHISDSGNRLRISFKSADASKTFYQTPHNQHLFSALENEHARHGAEGDLHITTNAASVDIHYPAETSAQFDKMITALETSLKRSLKNKHSAAAPAAASPFSSLEDAWVWITGKSKPATTHAGNIRARQLSAKQDSHAL